MDKSKQGEIIIVAGVCLAVATAIFASFDTVDLSSGATTAGWGVAALLVICGTILYATDRD